MRWIVGVAALVIVAGSLLADYKWRQWMARRREEREKSWGRESGPLQ